MASGATTPGANAAGNKLSKTAAARTRLIEQRLRRTRGQVKWTEMITAFLLFAAGSLVFLFAFVLVDHWVISGGVGFWGRLFCLLAFLAAGGYFLYRAVGPLITRRINPLYAAAAIERGQPALKNSLVNFLLLRKQPQDVNPAVFKAIQRRAARDLQDIHPEEVIDRSQLINAGYVLMTVVAVCCLYTLVSSKSPFRSVGRMFVPWADVEAPTRVGFSDVRPGSRQAFHDEFIDVSVLVQGIDEEEPVTLYYSTADGQSVDMPLVMTRPEDSFRHQVTLPPGSSGIQQDIAYYIAAGDARTGTYDIHVESAPAIIVDRVDFKYPDYTGLSDREQQGLGDIAGLEGTKVKISARANQPIKEAFVDFDCNGSRDLEMQTDGKLASVSFVLRMNEDRTAGEFESYEIRFTNEQGQENPRPARHRLEVTPDLPPEIEIVSPAVDEIEVPINAAVDLELRASDPDFKLSNVTIHARRADQVLLRQELLKDTRDGEFTGTHQLRPAKLGLKVGDEMVYWADARDNKRPAANRTQTIEYRLRVTEPAEQPPQEEQRREQEQGTPDEQRGERNEDEQPPMPEEAERPAESSETQEGQQEQAEAPENTESEPKERIDPEAQPGEAFEEILKHMEEEEKDPSENEDPQEQDQDDASQGGNQQQGGEEDQASEGGGEQGKDEQSPSESSDEQNPSGGQQGEGGDQQAGGGEQSSKGGQQGKTGSGAQQSSEGSEQAGGSGGQQESSDSSGNANRQQSPGGDESQGGGEGGMNSKDSSGSSEGTQSPGGEEEADQGEDSPAAKDGTPQRDRPGASKDGEREDSGRADSETKGDGGQSGGQGTEGSKQQPNESEKESDSLGGDPEKANGSGGAGEQSESEEGTGSKKGRQKPKDKQQQTAPSDQEADKDEASPESESGRESDSQGDNSGDKSGGGEEGAGQSSDSEGTGSAGSNTSAEEGAGQSEGAGSGPTSDQAGDKSASESGSDRPGEKAPGQGQSGGEGEQSSSGQPKDSSAGSGSSDSMDGQPPGGQNDSQQGNAPSQGTGGNGNTNQPQGQGEAQSGGQPSGNNSAADSGGDQPEAEDPNLDYAREATDLALEHLRDQLQQDEPDQDLLDRLQWTREDMEKFVNYWDQLKRQAAQNERGDASTEDELRDALQGLGLRRKSTQIDSGQSAGDQIRQLRESRRTSPPPEYAEQFRSFTEGTSRQGAISNESNN